MCVSVVVFVIVVFSDGTELQEAVDHPVSKNTSKTASEFVEL